MSVSNQPFLTCKVLMLFVVLTLFHYNASSKEPAKAIKISPDLFGIFFEDLSYAADGGLYAEMIQNRSFEYTPSDHSAWHSFTSWDFIKKGYGYGTISIETAHPIHSNNPHYVMLDIHEPFHDGIGLVNYGYDGISIKRGETYQLSVYFKSLLATPIEIMFTLRGKDNQELGTASFSVSSTAWKKYTAKIIATESFDDSRLELIAKTKGQLVIDMVSLFPEHTFKDRPNGLRADLAQVIADLHPKFMRFPGGCLVHGDGLGNIYRWKNTIDPVEERKTDRNIWNYHQSFGLGYFEYFQFCEDIGAKPLPVVAAGVSCQNSGGTWRIGGCGQKALSSEEMDDYIQEVLDLVEYANGPANSEWGSKRAKAGHPEPFNLVYMGIGNEDKITPEFEERYKLIADAVKKKYPNIIVVGTVGPFPDGEDYEKGWDIANKEKIEVVDEHMYKSPDWFWQHLHRYDNYDRNAAKVYIGEFAAHDTGRKNTFRSALSEAAFMTSLERNGDIVAMASYAPMLSNVKHQSWSPDLIYFNNTQILLTANYQVQKLFSNNQGDWYYPNVVELSAANTDSVKFSSSCVIDSETGDVIIKIVNGSDTDLTSLINLATFKKLENLANCSLLKGNPMDENTFEKPDVVYPEEFELSITKKISYKSPANSLTVIRIKKDK